MTPASLRRSVALAVLAAATAAVTAAPAAGAAVYCVERDADYVMGQRVHGGLRRCVPGP